MKASDNAHEIMTNSGEVELRVVHTTKAHPQIGYVHYQGQKQHVYVGFWGECPVWKLVTGPAEQQEYDYCSKRTVSIYDDPDYCGETPETT